MTLDEFEKEFLAAYQFEESQQPSNKRIYDMAFKLIKLARAARAKVAFNDYPHHEVLSRAVKEVFGDDA